MSRDSGPRPAAGSVGEHLLQVRLGTTERASQFYDSQVVAELTPVMREFIGRMEMAFIATSDAGGACDCSFRAGPAGFIRVIDDATIAYPDYRGNGVMASLGNMLENQHIGIFLVDFADDLVGLHVNGAARVFTDAEMRRLDPGVPDGEPPGRRAVCWVVVAITEAYIHCSKHIPRLVPQPRARHWGTDSPRHKRSDYFGAQAAESPLTLAGPGSLTPHGDHDQPR
jgi:predicted pyridoxine 5'-phosphate oxidase superfamily flavin-nucleotide-binding protein